MYSVLVGQLFLDQAKLVSSLINVLASVVFCLILDESPLDPIPKNGIDDIKYSRQISHESSSAPQSTSHR